MQDKENTDTYETRYAVPSYYDIYKTGGSTLKDNKRGMRLMLNYFSKYFTEEQLQANMQRYNIENMLAIVKDYFLKEYGYAGTNIELNNQYQRTINSYIYNDEKNPAIIHIDELFESAMMAFFLAMFKWSKDFDDLEVYKNCYLYVLFLMNDEKCREKTPTGYYWEWLQMIYRFCSLPKTVIGLYWYSVWPMRLHMLT